MSKTESVNYIKQNNTINNSKIINWLLVTLIVTTIVLIILGYFFGWAPIGVIEYSYKADGSLEGVKNIKTLWDWLDLFIVPAFIALSIWWITRLDERNKAYQEKQDELNQKLREDQFRAEQQARDDLEREISINRQHQTTIESYFDRIASLILEWNLLSSSEDAAVRTIARAITLATLRSLDGNRKGRLIRFLAETKLINISKPILILSGADLRETELRKANLSSINLIRANLSNSALNQICLTRSHLIRCNLSKVNLSHANLREAKLDRANFTQSYLVEANFSQASLIKVCFKDADLRRAVFTLAKVNGTNFANADLRGTNLREVNLDGANLAGIKYDLTTIWPINFDITTLQTTPSPNLSHDVPPSAT